MRLPAIPNSSGALEPRGARRNVPSRTGQAEALEDCPRFLAGPLLPVLQRAQGRDDRVARLPELLGQFGDRRSMLTVEKMPDDRVVKRRSVHLHFHEEIVAQKTRGFDYPALRNRTSGREVRHAEPS